MVHIIQSQNLASLKGKKQKPQKLSTANPLLQHARAQNETMSDQQQQQQQPGIILAANRRVPIPNSKYDDDAEDKEKEESRPKITKKARTPKAQKQSKTSSATVKTTTVSSSETDTDAEKEDAEDEKLVQPSKILIPQDGQQPKKWRLADQRR